MYFKILIVHLMISLFGTFTSLGMEKRKALDKLDENNPKRQRIEMGEAPMQLEAQLPDHAWLPDDKWWDVFAYFTHKEAINTSQVCKELYRLISTLYWPYRTVDSRDIIGGVSRWNIMGGVRREYPDDKIVFVQDLGCLFPNQKPYNLKIQVSEAELCHLHLLKDFNNLSLKIATYDNNAYQDRYNLVPLVNEVYEENKRISSQCLYGSSDHSKDSFGYSIIGAEQKIYTPVSNETGFQEACEFGLYPCETKLEFTNGSMPHFSFFHLPHLTNLTSLSYERPICEKYSDIHHISGLLNLRDLSLGSSKITQRSEFNHISLLTNLTSLKLNINGSMKDEDYEHPFLPISSLKNLTCLKLSYYDSRFVGEINNLSTLQSLTQLNLDHAISPALDLSNLDLSNFDMNVNLNFLHHLTNLETLNIMGMYFEHQSIESLSSLKALKKLKISPLHVGSVYRDWKIDPSLASKSLELTFKSISSLANLTYLEITIYHEDVTPLFVETAQNFKDLATQFPYIINTLNGDSVYGYQSAHNDISYCLKEEWHSYISSLPVLKTVCIEERY